MPLTRLQQRTVTLLAAHRNPESYVAGGAVLHVEGIRLSKDLDIFHDRERDVGPAARADPDRPETLVVHHGSRKGSWPSSPEIGSVMLRERPLPR